MSKEDTIKLLKSLRSPNSDSVFESHLHHFHNTPDQFSDYCETVNSFHPNSRNQILHERMQYILEQMGMQPLDKLVEEAIREIPERPGMSRKMRRT